MLFFLSFFVTHFLGVNINTAYEPASERQSRLLCRPVLKDAQYWVPVCLTEEARLETDTVEAHTCEFSFQAK